MEKLINKWTKQQLEEIVNSSKTLVQVSNKIGYSSLSPTAWKAITDILEKYGIEKPQFNNASNFIKHDDATVFCENSQVSQRCLRTRFIKKVPMQYCAICNLPTQWNGKSLTLRLDHINGVHNDNRLENLRWVCPNCDSQLDTYCGRNQKDKKQHNYCIDCGTEISKGALRCSKCSHVLQQKSDRPSREELKEMIRTLPFTSIGKQFNVSDNAIRKWCEAYNLPKKKSEINKYTEKEWQLI